MNRTFQNYCLRTLRGVVGLLALLPAAPVAFAEELFAEDIAPIRFADFQEQVSDVADGFADDGILLGPPLPIESLPIPSVLADSEGEVFVIEGAEILSGTIASQAPTSTSSKRVDGEIVGVSSRAADGLKIEDLSLDEMPYEASSGEWFSSGCWYAGVESLWFDRSRNQRVTLGRESSNSTSTVLNYTTVAQPFDVAPGARITLGKSLGRDYLDRDQFLEYVYYGGMNWSSVDGFNSLFAAPTLISPLAISAPGFNFANTFNTSLTSNFNSMEWNYKLRRRLGRDQVVMSPNGSWAKHAERGYLAGLIVGVRAANVNENFSFVSRRTGVDPSVFGGNYDISTQNWLFGLNLGGEIISQNEFYYWGLRGRVAPALSFAANQQSIVGVNTTTIPPDPPIPQNPSPDIRSSAANQMGPGFLGDLSLFGGWQVTPNFSVKGGYDFLLVAGIATATRQFNLDNRRQNPIDGGGQIFYNGVSFGCEGTW